MPYRMLNIIISICAHTLPLAAKIRDVIPTQAAISVSGSIFLDQIFEIITSSREQNQIIHSFLVKSFIGLLITPSRKKDFAEKFVYTFYHNLATKVKV